MRAHTATLAARDMQLSECLCTLLKELGKDPRGGLEKKGMPFSNVSRL